VQGAIGTLWCDLHDIADGGDHSIVVGHVTDLEQTTLPSDPLLRKDV
jgi:flavin reductase (DIM6/NTAB) family NADH-FMN oxidoreductase RutF